MISHQISPDTLDALLPKPWCSTEHWSAENVILPNESKLIGPIRWDLFPHAKGPMEAFDDPKIYKIVCQWASQLGKTIFAIACLLKLGHFKNRPMVLADSNEKSARRVARRIWKALRLSPAFAGQLPPLPQQSSEHIHTKAFEVHIAWAGSPDSAADYSAWLAILNEVDKMKRGKDSKEAHFPLLVESRLKGIHGAKCLIISTPSREGNSYVEAARLEGDNRRREIPCPHCEHFQELRTGEVVTKQGKVPGGIAFETRDGEIDAELARLTAYYQCERCLGRIEDRHRYEIFNAGLWVPEGCRVEKGKVVGTPVRPGRIASFGPLPELHSMLPDTNFGTYAEKYALSLLNRERRQDFINSSEARTFNPRPSQLTREQLIQRMGIQEPMEIVPNWATFLTVGSDVGASGDDLYFCSWVSAWGPGGRGQLIDLWMASTRQEFINRYRKMEYPVAGTGLKMKPVKWGVDSGCFTNEIYKLVKLLPGCWAIKGSSRDPEKPFHQGEFSVGDFYKTGIQRIGLSKIDIALKELNGQWDLLLPNTNRTQEWVENLLSGLVRPDEEDWYSLPIDAIENPRITGDLLRHLQGDYLDGTCWLKRYDDQHMRDGFRYSKVMAEFHTLSKWNRPRLVLPPASVGAGRDDDDKEDDPPVSGFVSRR